MKPLDSTAHLVLFWCVLRVLAATLRCVQVGDAANQIYNGPVVTYGAVTEHDENLAT